MKQAAAQAFILLCSLLLNQATLAQQGPQLTPREWLTRMGEAIKHRNYLGTFVYMHDGTLEAMRIMHRADQHGGIERLQALNGSGREVVRDHNSVTCILPDRRSVLVEKRHGSSSFPGALPTRTGKHEALNEYRFLSLGDVRVAGRKTTMIIIRPRDDFRYGYRIWLDRKTALPVRSDLVSESGHVIEQVMFTRLETPKHITDGELKPDNSGRGYVWNIQGEQQRLPVPSKGLHWRVTALPAGFSLSMDQLERVAGNNRPVRHLVFTDGLASVSVFAEPMDLHDRQLIGLSHMGAVNAYGRVVQGFHITVVGQVPARTVRLIGDSINIQR